MNRRPLTVALPKGRLAKQLAPRFAREGVSAETFSESDRRLQRDAVMGEVALRFLMLKPDDVPTYVEHGAADAGIVGRDVLLERGSELYVPLDLGLGRCRMVVAAPEGRGEALPATRCAWRRSTRASRPRTTRRRASRSR